MFDLVHKHKRFAQVLLFLIALTFVTWGLESYTSMRGGGDSVATVNGASISQREFSEELRRQQEQLRRMFGAAFDPAMLDTPESRQRLLDALVDQRVVATEAARANLFMSRDAVIEAITQAPEFQEDGKFSPARYSAFLAQRGLSDEANVVQLQSQIPLMRFVSSIADTAIAPRAVTERLANLETQKREISEAQIQAEQFLSQVKLDEGKLKEYYEANQADFRTPERVRAEYVVLSAEGLARQDPVTEEEIRKAYEARAGQYKVDEQRRASHILVKTKEEAERISEELKKAPGRFAELAKKHSQDPGSAASGGDLGLFGRGMMVKPFEDAAFGLKQGETSGPVQSEFGWHIIRVTGVQAPKSRPLEEVRKELVDELTRQKGARRFSEAAETFNNMAYEQPDSLKPVAERFKLPIQTTGWIGRTGNQELGALDHPKLTAALFSQDAIQNKRNTDAIEVAPNTLVAARVVEHQPARQRAFDEVKDQIAETLRRREAAALAAKEGEAKLEQLRKGEAAGVKWGQTLEVSRREPRGLPPEVLRRVVSADVSRLPAYVGIPIPDAGYVLLRISKVIEPDPKQQSPEAAARVAQAMGTAQYEALVSSLRNRADIEINRRNLEQK